MQSCLPPVPSLMLKWGVGKLVCLGATDPSQVSHEVTGVGGEGQLWHIPPPNLPIVP